MDYIMSLILQSSGGGQITVQEPATASNFTQTLPAATGTVMVSGNQPTFHAYLNSSQVISSATWTKVNLDTETFDTNSNFASSRFTPTVAGYYQINALITLSLTSTAVFTPFIYKNGSEFKFGGTATASSINFPRANISTLVYANGTTDYFEIFSGHSVGTSINTANSQSQTFFQAAYVRGA
jgi:hypothetical protein